MSNRMGMTNEERDTWEWLIDKLGEEGHPRFAKVMLNIPLFLTEDPETIGFMEPFRGKTLGITLNKRLTEDQASTVVRHEILHHYLEHELTLFRHIANNSDLEYDDLDDMSLKDLQNELYKDSVFNYAGDYDISKWYTDADKDIIKQLSGLLLEDDHPEWIKWPIEDIYDALCDLRDEEDEEIKDDWKDVRGLPGPIMPGGKPKPGGKPMPGKDGPEEGEDNEPGEDGEGGEDGEPGEPGKEGKSKGSKSKGSQKGKPNGKQQKGGESDDGDSGNKPQVIYGDFYNDTTFFGPDGKPVKLK